MRLLTITLVLSIATIAESQQRLTENTLTKSAGATPVKASLADMSWLTGHWEGEALGGISEEIWSGPGGGAMMGMYRLVKDGKPVFYELLTIVEENGSLVMRLKHFHSNLKGWEEKDKTVDFAYLGKRGDVVHFDGMAFRPEKDALTVWLAINMKDGVKEEVFRHRRVK